MWSLFFLALLNLWLDDGGKLANFYDKHGLTLQGNVEFMRNFGLEKNNLFRVDAARTYVRFNRKSHGSDAHPDLNMSFKTCNAKGKSVWGKSLDFLQFQHRGAGWSTFVF